MIFKQFLSNSEGALSSMRLSIILFTLFVSVLVLCIAFHILYMTYTENVIDWSNLGIFMGGIGTALSAVLGVKAYQVKNEPKTN